MRGLVIQNANRDLVLGAVNDAVVSVDDLHRRLIAARRNRREAYAITGANALRVLIPDARLLDWSEIDEVRQHPGFRDLRAVLHDIEAAAWDGSTAAATFNRAVHDAYQERLRRAGERIGGTKRGSMVSAVIGYTVGEAVTKLTGIPFVPGLVGAAAGLATDRVRDVLRRPRWLAADEDLRRRVRRAVGLSCACPMEGSTWTWRM